VIGIAGKSPAAAAAEEAQRMRYVQGGLDPSASAQGTIAVTGGSGGQTTSSGLEVPDQGTHGDALEAMRAKVREMQEMRDGVARLKAERENQQAQDAKLLGAPGGGGDGIGNGNGGGDGEEGGSAAGGRAGAAPVEGEMTAAELMDQAAKLAGFDTDGGAVADRVQTQLLVLGILPAPLAPRRRYSFGSESSVDWEGKDKDEAEEEAVRLEREEREAAKELEEEAREEREALGLPEPEFETTAEAEAEAGDGDGIGVVGEALSSRDAGD